MQNPMLFLLLATLTGVLLTIVPVKQHLDVYAKNNKTFNKKFYASFFSKITLFNVVSFFLLMFSFYYINQPYQKNIPSLTFFFLLIYGLGTIDLTVKYHRLTKTLSQQHSSKRNMQKIMKIGLALAAIYPLLSILSLLFIF